MKRAYIFFGFIILIFAFLMVAGRAYGQAEKETFTGTVLSYGTGFNTRATTRPFTLQINGQTSDADAKTFLNTLQENGQDALLRKIDDQDFGNFSVGGRVGRTINVVRSSESGGTRRIFIVFERWMQFSELRGGYRSIDYPFGVIELSIDTRTGKGSGTYIEAAKIRWDYDDKSKQYQVEVESFATFPAKLLAVTQSGRRAR